MSLLSIIGFWYSLFFITTPAEKRRYLKVVHSFSQSPPFVAQQRYCLVMSTSYSSRNTIAAALDGSSPHRLSPSLIGKGACLLAATPRAALQFVPSSVAAAIDTVAASAAQSELYASVSNRCAAPAAYLRTKGAAAASSLSAAEDATLEWVLMCSSPSALAGTVARKLSEAAAAPPSPTVAGALTSKALGLAATTANALQQRVSASAASICEEEALAAAEALEEVHAVFSVAAPADGSVDGALISSTDAPAPTAKKKKRGGAVGAAMRTVRRLRSAAPAATDAAIEAAVGAAFAADALLNAISSASFTYMPLLSAVGPLEASAAMEEANMLAEVHSNFCHHHAIPAAAPANDDEAFYSCHSSPADTDDAPRFAAQTATVFTSVAASAARRAALGFCAPLFSVAEASLLSSFATVGDAEENEKQWSSYVVRIIDFVDARMGGLAAAVSVLPISAAEERDMWSEVGSVLCN